MHHYAINKRIYVFYLYRVSYANINGTKYAKGCILLCTFWNDDPLFGKLVDLIVTEENICWFIMQPCIVKQFNEHYNGYEVELKQDYFVCQQEDLADYNPLTISKSFDLAVLSNFVVLKYHVFPY